MYNISLLLCRHYHDDVRFVCLLHRSNFRLCNNGAIVPWQKKTLILRHGIHDRMKSRATHVFLHIEWEGIKNEHLANKSFENHE